MENKTIDSIASAPRHKLMLVEEAQGEFSIYTSDGRRKPKPVTTGMTRNQAFGEWAERLYRIFLFTTGAPSKSALMVANRMAQLS